MERNVTMPTLESVKNFKAAMASEQGAFGPFMITSDPAFVETAGYAGYDFVLLDMEHGPGTFENLQNLIRAPMCPASALWFAFPVGRISGSIRRWTLVPVQL